MGAQGPLVTCSYLQPRCPRLGDNATKWDTLSKLVSAQWKSALVGHFIRPQLKPTPGTASALF